MDLEISEEIIDRVEKEKDDCLDQVKLTLYDSVVHSMDSYFHNLDGEPAKNVHEMVMVQVESALLSYILRRTRGNCSEAAKCLGMSRGTLLKKLKKYRIRIRKKGRVKS